MKRKRFLCGEQRLSLQGTLSPSQEEAASQASSVLQTPGLCYLLGPTGAGKTYVSAAIAARWLAAQPTGIVVAVVPAAVVSKWVFVLRQFAVAAASASSRDRHEVISPEKLQRRWKSGWFAPVQDPLLLILDEAHRYRNGRAGRTGKPRGAAYLAVKGVLNGVAPKSSLLCLTATPFFNREGDLEALKSFGERFVSKVLPEEFIVRLDAPQAPRTDVRVVAHELNDAERESYDSLLGRSLSSVPHATLQRHLCHPGFTEIPLLGRALTTDSLRSMALSPSSRMVLMETLCSEHTGGRVVVFCTYREPLIVAALYMKAKGAHVFCHFGGKGPRDLPRFGLSHNGRGPGRATLILFATTGAIGEGVDIAADLAILLDSPYSKAGVAQLAGRVRRPYSSSDRNGEVVELRAVRTVDDTKARIRDKKARIERRTGGAWSASGARDCSGLQASGARCRVLTTRSPCVEPPVGCQRAQPLPVPAELTHFRAAGSGSGIRPSLTRLERRLNLLACDSTYARRRSLWSGRKFVPMWAVG